MYILYEIICVRIYDEELSINSNIIELIPFSNAYNQVHKRADVIWKYRRYEFINDYENRPPLPPPINAFYFFYWIVVKLRYCVCCTDSQRRIINSKWRNIEN